MKHSTDCAQEYAERPRVSRLFRTHSLRAVRIVLIVLLALVLAPAAAFSKDDSLLDALLEVESERSGLCKAVLDAEFTRQKVGALVSAARHQVGPLSESATPRERAESAIRTLNGIVLGHAGIRPSQDLHDPCNLFLSSVLAQKQGYCVGVAAVYLVLAEEIGLPIRAVATPSHMFLRYDVGEMSINIDPLSQGAAIPDQQYIAQSRIAPVSVRKGVFLEDLTPDRFLAQVHNNLGVIYSEGRQFERAAAEYKEALRLDRRLPAAWYNLGKDLQAQGQLAEAVQAFTKALRLHPNDTWALNNRGMSYREMGTLSKARHDLEAALGIDPGFDQAKRNLAALHASSH